LRKLILLSIIVIFVSGCSGISSVEQAAKNALPSYLGPAKSYNVKIKGSFGEMVNGRVKHVHVEGNEVNVNGILKAGNKDIDLDRPIYIARLVVDADDVRYSFRKKELKKIGSAVVSGVVSEDSLNAYLSSAKDMHDMTIKLLPGKVMGEVPVCVNGATNRISIPGRAEVRDDTKIDFVPDSAAIEHNPARTSILHIVKLSNPLFDLSRLSFPVVLDKVTVEKGSLAFSGRGHIPAETKAAARGNAEL